MINITHWIKGLLLVTAGVVIFNTSLVQAAPVDLFKACNGSSSQVCSDTESQDVSKVMKTVIEVLIWASGIISVLMIIIGGFMYVLSAGDQAKVTKAKDTVLYAVIGLVVTLLAFSIVKFVLGYF